MVSFEVADEDIEFEIHDQPCGQHQSKKYQTRNDLDCLYFPVRRQVCTTSSQPLLGLDSPKLRDIRKLHRLQDLLLRQQFPKSSHALTVDKEFYCREEDGGHQQGEGEAAEVVLYVVTVRAELVHILRVEARVFSALVVEIPGIALGTVVAGDGDPVGHSLRHDHQAKGGIVEKQNGIFLILWEIETNECICI